MDRQPPTPGEPPAAMQPALSAPSAPSPPASQELTPVYGDWAGRPFVAQSAVAHVYPRWMTITLLSREATCLTTRLRPTDHAVQVTIPTGPDNDFFVNRDLAVPVDISGAVGVSQIPAGHVTLTLQSVEAREGGVIQGSLRFHFPTALDAHAPVYESAGQFRATVCEAASTQASMPHMDITAKHVHGSVGGRELALPYFLAYTRDDGRGGEIMMLKAYQVETPCHGKGGTPFLFGPEVGPGANKRYGAGASMPARWIMQMRSESAAERSVHAGDGAGWLIIDDIKPGTGGWVRGRMMAATVDETEQQWSFSVAGAFEAPMCGRPVRAW